MSKFKIIKKYIDEYDYYDLLAHGAPCDEFDSYSRYLAEIITANDTVDEIAAIIAQTMDKEFDEKVDSEKFLDTAQKIWNTLSERKDVNS